MTRYLVTFVKTTREIVSVDADNPTAASDLVHDSLGEDLAVCKSIYYDVSVFDIETIETEDTLKGTHND